MIIPASLIRIKVLFFGRVQGVGFRITTRRIAGEFQVSGYVRNLNDGSVELVAEGIRCEVNMFLESLRSKMADNINNEEVFEDNAFGEFDRFEIR